MGSLGVRLAACQRLLVSLAARVATLEDRVRQLEQQIREHRSHAG